MKTKRKTPKMKTAKHQKRVYTDTLGNSGAYFVYKEDEKKIIVVLYIKIPSTDDYMLGIYGRQFTQDFRLTSSELHEEFQKNKRLLHYNIKDYTPTEMHSEFHKQLKLKRTYGLKWFQDKYKFVENQLVLASKHGAI